MKPRLTLFVVLAVLSTYTYAQNGWRMDGYDGTMTYSSPAIGPYSAPSVQTLLTSPIVLSIGAIADDGSLIVIGGSSGNVSSYTPAGQLKWTSNDTVLSRLVAIGPSGTIYSADTRSVQAINQNTGQLLWTYTANSGDSCGQLLVGSDGTIYFTSGDSSNSNIPRRLVAINPDGTKKWHIDDSWGHYLQRIVLNQSGTVLYASILTQLPNLLSFGVHGYSTTNGQKLFSPVIDANYANNYFPVMPIFYAPWNRLYTDSYGGTASCSDDLLNRIPVFPPEEDPVAVTRNGRIITYDPYKQALSGYDSSHKLLWTSVGYSYPYPGTLISDRNGVLYVTGGGPNGNGLVAIDSATGRELWRLAFPVYSLGRVLLSGDGCLYLETVGSIYKICQPCTLDCMATAPVSTPIGTAALFTASVSPSPCVGSPVYDWDFGDGTAHSSQQNPAHTYTKAGTFTWTLTVTAPGVSACTKTGVITVQNSVSRPQITDVNPKVIPTGVDRTLTVDGSGFQKGFGARVKVGSSVFPINPGAQTIFVSPNRVQVIVKIGGDTSAPTTQFSLSIVNPDGQASNEFTGLLAQSAVMTKGANLAIAIKASSSSATIGSNFAYELRVFNHGPSSATSVVVTDNLPANVTYIPGSCMTTGSGVCDGTGNNRKITFPSLAGGAEVKISLSVKINDSAIPGNVIMNTAAVSSQTTDPNQKNNSEVLITPLIAPPLKLFFSNDHGDNHPLNISYKNIKRTVDQVLADVTLTNRTGTWFQLTINFNSPTPAAPTYVAVSAKQIPFSFLIGPFEELMFKNIVFRDRQYLHLDITRLSSAAIAMLGIDAIGRGLFGVTLSSSAGKSYIDMSLPVMQELLSQIKSGCAGDAINVGLGFSTCNGLFPVRTACIINNLAQFLKCTVGNPKLKEAITKLIADLYGKAAAKRWVDLGAKSIANIILILTGVPKLVELIDGTLTADTEGFVRLEARRQ